MNHQRSRKTKRARPENETGNHRPALTWLGRLAACVASAAVGIAINNVSNRVSPPEIALAFTLSGVLMAGAYIRRLPSGAGLYRYAPRLFLAPAGFAVAIAAAMAAFTFSSGTIVNILTALAAVLTVGAVLTTRELASAVNLLFVAAFIGTGAASIASGAGNMKRRAGWRTYCSGPHSWGPGQQS